MDDTDVLDRLTDVCQTEERQQAEALARQVMKDEERLAVLERMVMKLYEDMISGRISEQNFDMMMGKAQSEQAELKARLDEEKRQLADQSKLTADTRRWVEMIREYADIQELDADTLQRLIREITVHETIDPDGTRHITAKIHFNMKPLPEALAAGNN